jgi:hypothetical protein
MARLYESVSHLGFVVLVICPLPTLLVSPVGVRAAGSNWLGWCLTLDCALDHDPLAPGRFRMVATGT